MSCLHAKYRVLQLIMSRGGTVSFKHIEDLVEIFF